MKNIYLIGLPGSGKTTVGKVLAKELNMNFVDLDSYIEAKYNMSINDIFYNYSEQYFRGLETASLAEFKDKRGYVVSCGGGIVLNNNKKYMNGTIVYLDIPTDVISVRLKNDSTRPLMKTNTLDDLYKKRKSLYEEYKTVKITNPNLDESVEQIIDLVSTSKKTVLVLNGPNLNMLGKRDKEQYGTKTLDDIYKMILKEDYFEYEFFQSNCEGKIIDRIQQEDFDALIINPGALTHTSIALHDALEILKCEKVEVHLSDVDNREDFRRQNYVRDVCTKTISSLKEQSYTEACKYLQKKLIMLK